MISSIFAFIFPNFSKIFPIRMNPVIQTFVQHKKGCEVHCIMRLKLNTFSIFRHDSLLPKVLPCHLIPHALYRPIYVRKCLCTLKIRCTQNHQKSEPCLNMKSVATGDSDATLLSLYCVRASTTASTSLIRYLFVYRQRPSASHR